MAVTRWGKGTHTAAPFWMVARQALAVARFRRAQQVGLRADAGQGPIPGFPLEVSERQPPTGLVP